MRILIVEDERDIRTLLKVRLEQEGYEVVAVENGLQALEYLKGSHLEVNLAILDVMMPGLDGFNLLRKLRETSSMPVMFLTARGEEMDKVLGLGLGADDYMVKPFGMAELVARVSALLRRSGSVTPQRQGRLQFGSLILDLDACCVYRNTELVELNAKEFLLLKYLMENPGKVFTKKQIYSAVWNEDVYYDDNTVMVHVSHLRTKLENDPRNPDYIKTIRGIGYKFQK